MRFLPVEFDGEKSHKRLISRQLHITVGVGEVPQGPCVETLGGLKRPTAWRKVDAEPLIAIIHLHQKCYDQEGYVRSMKSVGLSV